MKTLTLIFGAVVILFGASCMTGKKCTREVTKLVAIDSFLIEKAEDPGYFTTVYDTLDVTVTSVYNERLDRHRVYYSVKKNKQTKNK